MLFALITLTSSPANVCWNRRLFLCSLITAHFSIKAANLKWSLREILQENSMDTSMAFQQVCGRKNSWFKSLSVRSYRVFSEEKDRRFCMQIFIRLVPSQCWKPAGGKSAWNLRTDHSGKAPKYYHGRVYIRTFYNILFKSSLIN